MRADPISAMTGVTGMAGMAGVVVGTLGTLTLGTVLVSACYSPGRDSSQSSTQVSSVAGQTRAAKNPAARCPQPDPGKRTRWRHSGSRATATLVGDAHHAASDPIVNPGQDARVRGKFAYGTISKDLQDEDVVLWLRMAPCGAWRSVAQGVTDSDGRVNLQVKRDRIPDPGAYPYQLIVRGDLSRAYGTIYVLPRGTQVVIFDIDGTLTTGDDEVVQEVVFGSDPEVRPGASAVVTRWIESGYLPIYITGRPYPLRGSTASWLHRHEFPPGPLITTDRFGEARPGEDGVGRFKYNALTGLRDDRGLAIVAAYGNASTDVCAYSQAGIDPERTFIVGASARRCEHHTPVQPMPGYVNHLQALRVEQAVR